MRILLFIGWMLVYGNSLAQPHLAKKQLLLMGSAFELIATDKEEATAWEAIAAAEKEIRRIEAMISSWQEDSYTSDINRKAGIESVPVPKEMFRLISRAQKVSDLTQGAFSLAFGSVYHLYDFKKEAVTLPSDSLIDVHVPLADYQNITLNSDNQTIMLRLKGMKIGFGAIGKGYAADRAKTIMLERGIQSGCINAGGDLTTWGSRPDGSNWVIGISDPKDQEEIVAYLPTKNKAIVTSGDYEKYFLYKGERYSHIVDPRTCRPVREISSATIICPSAELADALATAVCVLGKKDGLALVNKLNGIEAIIIDQNGNKLASENIVLEEY
ncbi:MAG: FAD:protein FMN transferase [Cytophagales bacterium]|nr:FAD:protein FMN transferase [Cytophagales bacterium]